MFSKYFSFLILLQCTTSVCLGAIQCLDPTGEKVDWFIIYKLPKMEHADPIIKEGYGHFYMDANNESWTLSKTSLNDSSGHALSHTLKQIYDNANSEDVVYALYSDQIPNTKNFVSNPYGHTKGSLAFDMTSGFWLVHSLPRFPQIGYYEYPSSGTVYGQMFLCMSLPYEQMDNVGKQWLYNAPHIYDQNFPKQFHVNGTNKYMKQAMNNKQVTKAPYDNRVSIFTIGGQEFISFAKSKKFKNSQDADLYSEIVAPIFGVNLRVASWRHGSTNLPSYCGEEDHRYQVENINQVSLPDKVTFNISQEHSKWAVSEYDYWVCIGDINRQSSQFKRSGGTVCANLYYAHKAFISSVRAVEGCPSDALTHEDDQLDICS